MKKLFLKKNNNLLVNLITYFVMFILGLITMTMPSIGFDKPGMYAAILFFILAFFSFGGYFYLRINKKSYEMLIFSSICIFTAAYLFVFEYATLSYALGTGFLMFTLLNAINRIYHISILKSENNPMWLMRSIGLILILFLSVLTIQNFYREISEVQTLMIGYYYLSYGLLSFTEIIILIYIKPESFEKFINGQFEELKGDKKINKFNENVDEFDKIVKNIDVPKKKNKKAKNKVTKK